MKFLQTQQVWDESLEELKRENGPSIQFQQERDKKREELAKLKKDFDSAKISTKYYETTVTKLTQELQVLDLKLTGAIQNKMLRKIKPAKRRIPCPIQV